jgi:hypothetical protein
MAKDLALRIFLVTRYFVHKEKTSFVKERFILDTMVYTWEDME